MVRATSQFSFDSQFLEHNPRLGTAVTSKGTEAYVVTVSDAYFKIGVDFHKGDGKETLGYIRTFNGDCTMYRYAGDQPSINVSKGANVTPDNMAPLGTVLFLPYGFLFPCKEVDKLPILTPSSLRDNEIWDRLGKSIVHTGEWKLADLNEVRIFREDGSYFFGPIRAIGHPVP